MAHCTSEQAEEWLDKQVDVLDKGFVRLVDYMGDDSRIVAAARVSYGKGTMTSREDAAVISYLLRNEHTSPFEQVVFTFHAKMPVFVARQWVRHRTARLNEMSGRYSVMKDEFYVPAPEAVAFQSTSNKQGRSEEVVSDQQREGVLQALRDGQRKSYENYAALIDQGIARELARINLPLSIYTEWYWQIDLNNLFRFLKLRLDSHAQMEIRAYAQAIHGLASKVCPAAFETFDNEVLGGVKLSKSERDAVRGVVLGSGLKLGDREQRVLLEKLGVVNQ